MFPGNSINQQLPQHGLNNPSVKREVAEDVHSKMEEDIERYLDITSQSEREPAVSPRLVRVSACLENEEFVNLMREKIRVLLAAVEREFEHALQE